MKKTIKKRLLLFILIAFALPEANTASADHRYVDIAISHKYQEAIDYISEKDIVSGYPDGTYKPENILNRAELLKIIIEAVYDQEFIEFESKSCFADIPENQWYTKYVCFAKEQGFVVGYSDNKFRPEDQINLVEALKITLEVFNYPYIETDPWYKGIVDEAADKNFISVDFKKFDQKINRGQMADLITRILKFKEQELEIYLGDNFDQQNSYEKLISFQNNEFDPLANTEGVELSKGIKLNVPFTSQAPLGEWIAPYDEACEEAVLTMVEYFLRKQSLTKETAKMEILKIIDWEDQEGYGIDIGTSQMKKIMEEIYGRKGKIYQNSDVSIENIKKLLNDGYPVIVPVAGNILLNPNYQAPYHVIVIIGYDESYFYTHDPGTRLGNSYEYTYDNLLQAIHDWAGSKQNVLQGEKSMVVIEKEF